MKSIRLGGNFTFWKHSADREPYGPWRDATLVGALAVLERHQEWC